MAVARAAPGRPSDQQAHGDCRGAGPGPDDGGRRNGMARRLGLLGPRGPRHGDHERLADHRTGGPEHADVHRQRHAEGAEGRRVDLVGHDRGHREVGEAGDPLVDDPPPGSLAARRAQASGHPPQRPHQPGRAAIGRRGHPPTVAAAVGATAARAVDAGSGAACNLACCAAGERVAPGIPRLPAGPVAPAQHDHLRGLRRGRHRPGLGAGADAQVRRHLLGADQAVQHRQPVESERRVGRQRPDHAAANRGRRDHQPAGEASGAGSASARRPRSPWPHGGADIIDISAKSTDPPSAAIIADTYANTFIQYSQTQDIDAALAAEAQIQTKISALQPQIDSFNSQIAAATAKNQAAVSATLGPQVDALTAQQSTFKQQLAQIQVQAAVSSGDAQLVSAAPIPTTAVSPKPVRDLILAILAGLMLGVGAAFCALEYFDDSVKSREDLDRALAGTPNVGLIPQVPGWKDKNDTVLVTVADPTSPTAEAFRSLRTSLQFASLDRPLRTILVTSPSAGEGKTTILANLGVSMAQAGQRVILAGCDLRRPRLHEFFGVTNTTGFTSVLLGQMPAFAALQQVANEPNLFILASGPLPSNPSELLSTDRAAEVLAALQGEADIVLIDSPPLLPVTDAAVLTRLVDATLLVVTVGSTTRKQIAQALEVLGQVDAPLIGTVLNNVGSEGSYTYKYEPDQAPRRRQPLPTKGNNGSRPVASSSRLGGRRG